MTTYYTLYIQCPACIRERKIVAPASYWYHSDCGGKLEIGDNANYRCQRCYYSSHIRYWRYSCSDHFGSYRATSSSHFASAASAAGQLKLIGADIRWLYRMLDNLGDW